MPPAYGPPLTTTIIQQIGGPFTAGRISFGAASGGGLSEDSQLFYDNATNFLGIGAPAPARRLHLGDGTADEYIRISALNATWDMGSGAFASGDGWFAWVGGGNIRFAFSNSGNLAFLGNSGGSASMGGATGAFFVANATVVPSSNPSGGALWYTEAGASKARGSGGTVTTFAPA